jgi:predicted RNA-binding Zn-ribbon protein involved in translation (DUF1610 family)
MEKVSEEFTPQPFQYCADCGASMLRARVTHAFLALPELQTFRCPRCGNVVTWVGASVVKLTEPAA